MTISDSLLQCLESNDPSLKKILTGHRRVSLDINDIRLIVDAIKKNNNPHIGTVIIPGGRFGDEGIETISQVSTIRYLAVEANKLTDRSALAISRLPNLEVLRISANKLTIQGFKHILEHCPKLKNLVINNNLIVINDNDVKELLDLIEKNKNMNTLLIKNIGIANEIPAHVIDEIENAARSRRQNISSTRSVVRRQKRNHDSQVPENAITDQFKNVKLNEQSDHKKLRIDTNEKTEASKDCSPRPR